LLEALPAKHRSALRWLERDGGFLAASGTIGARLDLGIIAGRGRAQTRSPFGFAGLAPLRLVLELLIVEEKLFTSGENKVSAAIDTL